MDGEWTTVTKKQRTKKSSSINTNTNDSNNNSNELRDYNPVVFRQKNTYKGKPYVRSNTKRIEENAEDGDYQLRRANKNLQDKIKNQRSKMKLTQKELANKCNLPLNIIQEYESGKGIPSVGNLNKISRVLNIPLSNK